jgi:two-component system sensor histidine kinase PhoQ
VKPPLSIRARLGLGAALVLLAFLAGAGWAVQQAHADSVRAARFARLQTTVYLLMAGAELNARGSLVMPAALAEPRLSLPASGLYANIANLDNNEEWQSLSTLGLSSPPVSPPPPGQPSSLASPSQLSRAPLPFQRRLAPGQWQFEVVTAPPAGQDNAPQPRPVFLAASYAVTWSDNDRTAPLVFSVLEDASALSRELRAFDRTLLSWLGGTALLLLLTQALLLRWGLAPLRGMAREIQRIEQGDQGKVEGRYPSELAGLTHNLNGLIDQERARQTRYKEALDDLAHSLKTPLAALRATLDEPDQLPAMVAQQVTRMDGIVMHQLGRAGASGAARLGPQLALAPIVQRIQGTLAKVYLDKNLTFTADCPPGLSWRLDEGDAFELLGNLLDNAAKWARSAVSSRVWLQDQTLCIRITDDGPGFADDQALPGRRVRLDEQVPGHGIGLAVVRDLVASHQGELRVSRAPGGGAQVDVVLRAA